MIFRVFALVAILFLVFWGLNSVSSKYSLTRKQANLLLIVGVILTAIVVLIGMGRLPIHFIVAPIGVALTFMLRMLPTAMRLLPLWQMLKSRSHVHANRSRKSENQASVIRTEYLAMELQHSTGDMDGSVTKGMFEGRRLSTLLLAQILQLAEECRPDHDSLQVLEAYLDRMHPQWREQAQGETEQTGPTEESAMSKDLALEILGLSGTVTKQEVNTAHRKLMQKMHPDRGGTDYLAKKINAAKDYLMEHL
ncbi:MAG: hypothetical protein JKY98_06070 [Gammaproteobacteria bacterium]|nr:hypothetical protein [Gammaproteobacteria bacterium]